MKTYKYIINGTNYSVGVGDIEDNKVTVEVNGTPYNVELDKAKPVNIVKSPRPAAAPRTATGEKVVAAKPAATGSGATVKAPLPGVVLNINVKEGQEVKASDVVLTIEAMKMENSIYAGQDGKVTSIMVSPGDTVAEGAALLTIA